MAIKIFDLIFANAKMTESMNPNFKIERKNNRVVIHINLRLYSLEALYGAAYVFLDRAYLFFEGNSPENIIVYIKGKKNLSQKGLDDLAGDFCNEILNHSLRNKISKENQKLREYILARALAVTDRKKDCVNDTQKNPAQKEQKWEKDSLGIALPWNKKYKI
jgi:His-Xaa-Ser system protein HxsD